MQIQTQITWRGMEPSRAVEEKIRKEAAKLEEFYDRITSCRVMIEIPHQHRHRGHQFHIRIDLTVPGGEIVANHEPDLHSSLRRRGRADGQGLSAPHQDIYAVIKDAFKTARRQVLEYAQRRKGAVKRRETYTQENLFGH